jgi:O-antigen/teichoic acid export membrane protein
LAFTQGLLLVPLYLKYIPVDVYGSWLATGNILAWISTVDPGLTIVMNQQISFYYGKRDLQEVGKLIGSGLILSCLVLIGALSFGFFSSLFLIDILNITEQTDVLIISKAFNYAFIGASFMLFSFAISAINYGLQSSLSVGLINTTTIFLSIILTIGLLNAGYELMAIAYSLVFSGVSLVICNLFYLFFRLYTEKIIVSVSFNSVGQLSKLLALTLFSRVSGIISNNIDLLLVSRFLGPEILTAYAMSKKPVEISKELINQPVVGYQSVISNMKGSMEMYKLRVMLSRLIVLLIWITVYVIGGLISFNSGFVNLWVGESYFIGSHLNLILCIGAALGIFTQSAGYFTIALGDIKGSSIAGALQSVLYIPLIYFGLVYFGLYGLVFAPIISLIFTTTWFYPHSIQNILRFSSNEMRTFLCQLLYSLFAAFIGIVVFFFVDIRGRVEFCVNAVLYTVLYAAFLFCISELFRLKIKELLCLFKKKLFNLGL